MRLPVGPDVGGVSVQCVNLGLVGLLRHDPDYVGPCLQQCYPPQPWPANLTNKDLGHTHPPPHRINTEFVNAALIICGKLSVQHFCASFPKRCFPITNRTSLIP